MVEQVSAKGKLEGPDREERYSSGFIGCRRVLQEEPVITDEPIAVAEHKCEADGVEEDAAKAGIHHTLHQNIYGFAGATEAGFQHGKADLHAEYRKAAISVQAVFTGLTTSEALTSGVPVWA